MKSFVINYAVLSTAVLSAAATPSGVVQFDLRRKAATSDSNSTVLRPLNLNDHWIGSGGYFIDISAGTPPQKFEVLVDTGSSNLFFPAVQAPPCLAYQCPGGSFDPTASSSYELIQDYPIFNISYQDGSVVVGNYSTETMAIGEVTLSNFTFAVANQIQVSPHQDNGAQYGILGVSGRGQEQDACASAQPGCPGGFFIPTIHDALYSAGYTKSRSFSLYLDSIAEQKGSILFGGIDTAKFTGQLTTLAVVPDILGDAQNGTYVGQDIYLTSVSGVIGGNPVNLTDSSYTPATNTIDSGAAKMSVPEAVYNALGTLIPAAILDNNGQLVIPCDYANSGDSLSMELTGYDGTSVTVNVPAQNLVVPYYGPEYNSTTLDVINGTQYCQFGIQSGGALLGDPLIRSVYINYNLDEHTISLAQASYNTKSSNIVAVGPGPLPALTGTGASNSSSPSGYPSPSSTSPPIQTQTTNASPSSYSAPGFIIPLLISMLAYLSLC